VILLSLVTLNNNAGIDKVIANYNEEENTWDVTFLYRWHDANGEHTNSATAAIDANLMATDEYVWNYFANAINSRTGGT
jgi:hypothetical protein